MSSRENHGFDHGVDNSDNRTLGEQKTTPEDDMGPSISMAVEADDHDTFNKSTFNLKRTRSMGLLDEFIDPTKKLLGRDADGRDGVHVKDFNDDNDYDDNENEYYNSNDNETDSEEDVNYRRLHSASVSPPPADTDALFIPQDDNDVVEEPKTHVDYLSHHWKESEISGSWKYIKLKKKKRDIDVVNTARLENASWRTWAKARNHLKTVSPEVVNWSKDSDVTWLYGPIMRDESNDGPGEEDMELERGYGSDDDTYRRVGTSTSNNCRSSNRESFSTVKIGKKDSKAETNRKTPKPILKKRTMEEIIEENALWRLNEARKHINEMRHASVIMDPTGKKPVHDDFDALAARVNAQYYASSKRDDTATHYNSKYSNNLNADENSNTLTRVKSHEDSYANTSLIGEAKRSTHNEIANVKNDIVSLKFHHISANNSSDSDDNSTKSNESSLSEHYSRDKRGLLHSPYMSSKTEDFRNSPILLSILASSKSSKSNKDRHIHFNDRVEQCMAIKESQDESRSPSDQNYNQRGYFSGFEPGYSHSDSEYETDSEDDEDENSGGLFISARFNRKNDSGPYSPVTDTTSIGSSLQSRTSVRPIIKLLPATTLNYGTDDDSDKSDTSYYGNAVSHNVNTSRGYDYIYDYNTVYTGDTSNFFPVDNCDIVDVPEGIDLNSAIAEDNSSTFELPLLSSTMSRDKNDENVAHDGFVGKNTHHLHPVKSPAEERTGPPGSSVTFYTGSDEGSEDEFIEDSRISSSSSESGSFEEDDNKDTGLSLRRTVSLGKPNTQLSFESLQNASHQVSPAPVIPHNFITGKPHNELSDAERPSNTGSRSSLRRNHSSNNFIFTSDSEDEKTNDGPRGSRGTFLDTADQNTHTSTTVQPIPRRPPPQRRQSSGLINTKVSSPECNKAFRRIGSSSPTAGLETNEVKGFFAPRNDSVKSVITKNKAIITPEHAKSTTRSEDKP